jgi:hypothetical protein
LHDEQEHAFSAVEAADSAVTESSSAKIRIDFRKPSDSLADTIPEAATSAAGPKPWKGDQ